MERLNGKSLNGRSTEGMDNSTRASLCTRKNLKWRLSEKNKIQVMGLVCVTVVLYQLWQIIFGMSSCLMILFRVALMLIPALLTAMSLHISLMLTPDCTPARIMILQYLFYFILGHVGDYYLKQLEKESLDSRGYHEKFILRIMKSRSDTQYGRDFGFGSVTSTEDFRKRHPLTTYAHYEKYFERVAAGETDIVVKGHPSRLGITSGTTGKPKLLPITKIRKSTYNLKLVPMVFRFVGRNYTPKLTLLQKNCLIYIHTKPSKTEGGVTIGPSSMLVLPDILHRVQFSTPPAGMRITDERQALYVHALFALRDRCLGNICTVFCSTVFNLFQVFEQHWPSLVDDLRHGKVADHVGLDDDVKAALELEIESDPERADEVEREFRKGFDDISRRLWPHLRAIFAVSTGVMVVYARRLRDKYTKGIPIVSTMYSATEGPIAALYEMTESSSKYIPVPSVACCEFIPVDQSQEENPPTLLAEEVKVGETYEVVVTTLNTIYRYRMGDVVKIVGFHNTLPLLEFQYRTGEVLSIRGEKTPEASVAGAIVATLESRPGLTLVDFTAAESPLYEEAMDIDWSPKGYYMIFIEVEDQQGVFVKEAEQQEKFIAELESNLRSKAHRYNHYRSNGSLAPISVIFLKTGAVDDLRKYILKRSSATSQQLKLPHKLRKAEWVRHLCAQQL